MHVAVLDEWLPFPVDNGKKLRSYHLLAPLARDHQVSYICPHSEQTQQDLAVAKELQALGVEVHWVDRRVPPNGGPWFAPRLAGNLLSAWPYSVQRHHSPAMQRVAEALDRRHKVDLWHVEWTPYLANLPGSLRAPVVINAHNIESLIWERYYTQEKNRLKAWYIKQQWMKFQNFEKHAFAVADCVVTTTEQDAHLARQAYGARNVQVVSNGVDLATFSPQFGGRDPQELLFLGSLTWRPNLDAVTQLLDYIFPAIRKQLPEMRLTIVGLEPPAWLRARVQGETQVSLHASVPDVRPYLRRCGALVVPLSIGGGSRIKIIEALAAGCPVIATRVGAEGLELRAGVDFIEVDDNKDFARVTVAAIAERGPLEATARQGEAVVRSQYGWDRLAQQLEGVWQSQLQTRVVPRAVLQA